MIMFNDLVSVKFKEIWIRNACMKCLKMNNLWLEKKCCSWSQKLSYSWHITYNTAPHMLGGSVVNEWRIDFWLKFTVIATTMRFLYVSEEEINSTLRGNTVALIIIWRKTDLSNFSSQIFSKVIFETLLIVGMNCAD